MRKSRVSGEAAGALRGRAVASSRVERGVTGGLRSAELLLRVRKDGVVASSL
jgi:hypothetical protein